MISGRFIIVFTTKLRVDSPVVNGSIRSLGSVKKQDCWIFDVVCPELPVNTGSAKHFIPRAQDVEGETSGI